MASRYIPDGRRTVFPGNSSAALHAMDMRQFERAGFKSIDGTDPECTYMFRELS